MIKRLLAVLVITLTLTGCSTVAAATTKPEAPPASMPKATTVSGDQIQYSFTQAGQHPEKMLVDVINGAKSSLDIAIYSLTQKDIVAAILDAKKRGLEVRIITDRTEAKTKSQAAALKELKAAGIPIKENTHSGLMHLKVTIADKAVVMTGSYNYSESASTVNDEVLMVIRDPKIATDWEAQFERMWKDIGGFTDFVSSGETTSSQAPSISASTSAKTATRGSTDVYYANCTAVKSAGAAPLYRGQPGYSRNLDRDGDGMACEK